jgi:two-component system, OmpR family, phosphate regulon sensor histidine kinase PhoR
MSYSTSNVDLLTRIDSLSRVAWEKQSYMNMLYLLVSFPLGILYFLFFALGLTISFASVLILSIPTLIFVIAASRYLAEFERAMVIAWLHVDIRPMSPPLQEGLTWWERLWEHLSNPVTWKSLVFLLAKCPLGILSIVIMGSLCVLAVGLACILLPVGLLAALPLYLSGILADRKARKQLLLVSLTGFGFGPVSLHILNGVAFLNGQFAHAMLGMTDKDIKLAQAKALVEEERAKAAQAESSRRELIVNVSHELRTPIASIRGHIESLLMEIEEGGENAPSKDAFHDYLAIVHREVERLGALVEDLLSLARSDAGELRLDIAPVRPGRVVEEVYEAMALLARRERQITLVHSIPPALPLVLADQQRLTQVLLNLVRNAITYTPEGGIVSMTLEQADTDHLALIVADTGIGIPGDELEHVFERFYRTDVSRTRSSGGFGLGLAIVRDLVNAMGGSIIVESTPGEGSCFRVVLRIAEPAHQSQEEDSS